MLAGQGTHTMTCIQNNHDPDHNPNPDRNLKTNLYATNLSNTQSTGCNIQALVPVLFLRLIYSLVASITHFLTSLI